MLRRLQKRSGSSDARDPSTINVQHILGGPARPIEKWNAVVSLVVAIAVPLMLGAALNLTFNPHRASFSQQREPSWTPSSVVWCGAAMALYVMMGFASWLVYTNASPVKRKSLLSLYALQLLVNLLWPPLAFGMQNLEAALIDSYLLLILVMVCVAGFGNVDKLAAYLLFPYALWAHGAAVFSTHLFVINRFT